MKGRLFQSPQTQPELSTNKWQDLNMNWRQCALSVLICCRLETGKQVKGDNLKVPSFVCATVSVTYDLERALRHQHPHINSNTYWNIMWVSAYVAQLSAARAALYRKGACIAGHYGNSRASGNHKFCPPFLKVAEAQGERRGCKNTTAHTSSHNDGCQLPHSLSASPSIHRIWLSKSGWSERLSSGASALVCRGPERNEEAFFTCNVYNPDIRDIFRTTSCGWVLCFPVLLCITVMNVH